MPRATGNANENTNPSASSSGAQPSLPTGTQAPQATPAGGSSPNRNPEDDEPLSGTTDGGDFYSYGIVIAYKNNPTQSTGRPPIPVEEHYVKVRLVSPNMELIYRGTYAQQLYNRIGPWSPQSNVKVTFNGSSDRIILDDILFGSSSEVPKEFKGATRHVDGPRT